MWCVYVVSLKPILTHILSVCVLSKVSIISDFCNYSAKKKNDISELLWRWQWFIEMCHPVSGNAGWEFWSLWFCKLLEWCSGNAAAFWWIQGLELRSCTLLTHVYLAFCPEPVRWPGSRSRRPSRVPDNWGIRTPPCLSPVHSLSPSLFPCPRFPEH